MVNKNKTMQRAELYIHKTAGCERQAQVAVERGITWDRWHTCGLCEQRYHSVVKCAIGWACWKTYLHRPYIGWCLPMNLLK